MYPNAPNGKSRIVEKDLSYKINGLLYKVHSKLGRYHRERQYGDEFELMLKEHNFKYEREKAIVTADRKSNLVDFCIDDRILVDFKAKPFITKEDYYQMQRYLRASNKELGIIANFRQKVIQPKRVLNSGFHVSSERSDKFVG